MFIYFYNFEGEFLFTAHAIFFSFLKALFPLQKIE